MPRSGTRSWSTAASMAPPPDPQGSRKSAENAKKPIIVIPAKAGDNMRMAHGPKGERR